MGQHMPKKCDCGRRTKKFDEFDVREIDQHGDAQNVSHFDSLDDARTEAEDVLTAEIVATVIEHHVGVCCEECGIRDDEYETVATAGDETALREGGWI